MKKINTMLVGLGGIGFYYDKNKKSSYFSHIKSLLKLKYIKVICGVDTNKKRLLDFKKIYKIDISNDIVKSLKKHKPKFVVVSVNISNLFKILKIISNFKSVKNVLVEKPGAENFEELNKIYSIYKKSKINLFINYNRSYQKKILAVFSLLKKKKYFKLVYIYNRGLLNNCSHLLNLMFLHLDLPKNFTILNKGSKFGKDIQPDVKLNFKNGEAILIANGNNKIIHNELIFFNNKLKINSNEIFTKFTKFKLVNNRYIKKHKNYKFNQLIEINKKNYQTSVYENILKNKNSVKNKNIFRSSLKVLNLYKKIYLKYKKF